MQTLEWCIYSLTLFTCQHYKHINNSTLQTRPHTTFHLRLYCLVFIKSIYRLRANLESEYKVKKTTANTRSSQNIHPISIIESEQTEGITFSENMHSTICTIKAT